MADSFIIFTPNPPCISTLTSSGKQSEWKKLQDELKRTLENYNKNNFANQEIEIFDFLDKPISELTRSHFLKMIKKLIEKIKDEIKENNLKPEPVEFNKEERDVFTLTYKNIFALANIIIYIIENTTSKGKLYDIVYDFAFSNQIPSFKDNVIQKQVLSKLMIEIDSIKTLNLSLYQENDYPLLNTNNNNSKVITKKNSSKNIKTPAFKFDTKIVFFFSIFYKSLFKSVLSGNIDLNIPPIDKYFVVNNNPYLVNENEILKMGDYYKDIILCNLILIKAFPSFNLMTNLSCKFYDSYQLELHKVLSDCFIDPNSDDYEFKSKNSKSEIKKIFKKKSGYVSIDNLNDEYLVVYSPKFNNNYLYIHHLLAASETKFYNFSFDFNSLDPLLFNSVNQLLMKFIGIVNVNLALFPRKLINKRKTYINNNFYNKYLNNDFPLTTLYSSDDKKIYYQYLDKNDNNSNNFILKDEKLLNELFQSFNNNLRCLSIILEKKITELLSLKIDFSTYNNESIKLCNYDNYNCSLVCFIFDLFKSFQSNIDKCHINTLELFYDDFLDEKSFVVETIKRKIPSCKNGFKLNKLKLNSINLNISNISLFLPFENFPTVNLTQLTVSNLSYYDLNNLVNAFKKNRSIFPCLIKLDVGLGIIVEDYNKPLKDLLAYYLPNVVYFYLCLPFNISVVEMINILSWIKCNHNAETAIFLKLIHSQLSQCINHYYFKNCVIDLFNKYTENFEEKKIENKYEIMDEQNIKFQLYKPDYWFFYKFIFCFEKKSGVVNGKEINVLNKNVKVNNNLMFEKIFKFMGRNKKKDEVNIEIIGGYK